MDLLSIRTFRLLNGSKDHLTFLFQDQVASETLWATSHRVVFGHLVSFYILRKPLK